MFFCKISYEYFWEGHSPYTPHKWMKNYLFCNLTKDQLLDKSYINELVLQDAKVDGLNKINVRFKVEDVIVIEKL